MNFLIVNIRVAKDDQQGQIFPFQICLLILWMRFIFVFYSFSKMIFFNMVFQVNE